MELVYEESFSPSELFIKNVKVVLQMTDKEILNTMKEKSIISINGI